MASIIVNEFVSNFIFFHFPQNVKNVFSVNCVGHIVDFDYAFQNTIKPFSTIGN
jgi:hypothetical protein